MFAVDPKGKKDCTMGFPVSIRPPPVLMPVPVIQKFADVRKISAAFAKIHFTENLATAFEASFSVKTNISRNFGYKASLT